LIWIQYAKVIKKREKQKLENESEQKKRRRKEEASPLGPIRGPKPTRAGLSPQPPFLPLSFSFLFF
jgi:hypothetical protein